MWEGINAPCIRNIPNTAMRSRVVIFVLILSIALPFCCAVILVTPIVPQSSAGFKFLSKKNIRAAAALFLSD